MSQLRETLNRYAESGTLSAEALAAALQLAGETPDVPAWRRFIDRLLTISGALLAAVGLIFFVAFNWNELGRFAKLGMLEALVLLPTLFALFAGLATVRAKAALLFAMLALGGLLALIGQTYQTGADNYELFLAWALLALPWVLAGRWAPPWALWWTLLNVALLLYLSQVLDPLALVLFGRARPAGVALLNLAGLAAFEWAYAHVAFLHTRWLARYCLLAALAAGGFACFSFMFDHGRDEDGSGVALYWLMIIAGAWFYQYVRRDLFPLAFGVLSLIAVVTTWLAKHLFKDADTAIGAFALLSFVVIGSTIAATYWLRELNRRWDAPAASVDGEAA